MSEPLTTEQLDNLRTVRQITDRPEGGLWQMQTTTGRTVMLKTLPTRWLAFTTRTLFATRLQRLINITHPHIVPILGGRVRRNQCSVVLEASERGSLLDAVAPGPRRLWTLPLAPREAVRLVAEAAEGVAAIHAHQELHGGLKLTNILLNQGVDGQWHAAVTDAVIHLGLEGYSTASFQRRLPGIGDPLLYVAPEQFHQRPTLASDQFALATIAFILLTGAPPYIGDPEQWLRADIPPALASHANPALPIVVDGVLIRGLQRNPRGRYRTVLDFAAALRQAAQIPEVARSMSLEIADDVAGRAPGPITLSRAIRPHEVLDPPRPLATLSQEPASGMLGLPDLPPNYSWTREARAVGPPVPLSEKVIVRHPLSRLVTYGLITAVVGVALIMIVLVLVLVLQAAP